MSAIVREAQGQLKVTFTLLAGSGLRMREMTALEVRHVSPAKPYPGAAVAAALSRLIVTRLRADPDVCFGKHEETGEIVVGLRSRVG